MDTITFWSSTDGGVYADTLARSFSGLVRIEDIAGECVLIESEAHARELISALEKAIKLKWFTK